MDLVEIFTLMQLVEIAENTKPAPVAGGNWGVVTQHLEPTSFDNRDMPLQTPEGSGNGAFFLFFIPIVFILAVVGMLSL